MFAQERVGRFESINGYVMYLLDSHIEGRVGSDASSDNPLAVVSLSAGSLWASSETVSLRTKTVD